MHISVLDSSPQKSKIAVKNPRVRPPKDARSLLHTPSLNPAPPHPPAKKPIVLPVGGLGIGIKLPGRSSATNKESSSMSENDDRHFFSGLNGGLNVLKKTQLKVRDSIFPNVTMFLNGLFFNLF